MTRQPSGWTNRRLRGVLMLTAAAAIATGMWACDDGSSSSSSSSAQPAGNPIDKLADNPESLPGRSAGYARSVVEKAGKEQAAESALANEINGGGGKVTVAGLTWTVPGAWMSEAPGTPMRKAQYSVPGGATIYWSYIEGAGGTTEMNIERWSNQVLDDNNVPAEPNAKEQTIAGSKVTTVFMEGTYMDGMPGSGSATPRRRWALRGAIIEGPQGTVFIKMVGPRPAVEEAQSDWDSMISSMTG